MRSKLLATWHPPQHQPPTASARKDPWKSKLLEKPARRQTETRELNTEHQPQLNLLFSLRLRQRTFEDTSPDAWLLGRAGSSPPLENKAEAADTKIFARTPRRPEIPLLRPQSPVSNFVFLLLVVFRMRHSGGLPTLNDGVKQVPNEGYQAYHVLRRAPAYRSWVKTITFVFQRPVGCARPCALALHIFCCDRMTM